MKHTLILLLAAGSLSLFSCSRKDDYNPSQTPRVQTFGEEEALEPGAPEKPAKQTPVRPVTVPSP